jgi:hypothetical protein
LPPLHRHIQRASTPGTGPSRDPTPVAPKSRGPTAPPVQPRSVLVVSHDLDGFLRAKDRGLVASRYRSWGSPRFAETRSHDPPPVTSSLARRGCPSEDGQGGNRGESGLAPRDAILTLRRVPPVRSRTVSPRPVPPCRWEPPFRVEPSTSRRCSACGVRLRPAPLRAPNRSFLPWACVPFEVRRPPCLPSLRTDRGRFARSSPGGSPEGASGRRP